MCLAIELELPVDEDDAAAAGNPPAAVAGRESRVKPGPDPATRRPEEASSTPGEGVKGSSGSPREAPGAWGCEELA